MPIPSQSYITLVGGLNAVNSTIYTNSLIKIGDTIKVTGTASNNNVYAVTDVVTTASTGEGVGTTFTQASCTVTSGDATITHSSNTQIIAGLSVSGTGIRDDSYILSITDSTNFELSKTADGSGTRTLTFGDMDIYYTVKGGALTNENSGGNPQIEVIRAPGDKLVALGDVDSAGGVDVWSNNATTDYIGTSPASADGWEASAISPTLNGDDAKYIYHFVDEALRVCNTNEQNTSLIKWYGYIQRQQFNNQKGLLFAEWQEHSNSLAPPKLATTFTHVYGHGSHDGSSSAIGYYKNKRGVVIAKEDSTSALRLNGDHSDTTTAFTFENSSSANVLDQSSVGEVISIGVALGAVPDEYLFCKKESGSPGGTITYSRSYGGTLSGDAPASYSDTDTPILERGLGFNVAISDGTDDGDWEEGTYEVYETFIYDGNQESLPVKLGDGAATTSLDAFTYEPAGNKSLRISVMADNAYSGRITGGRVYTRLSGTDDDLSLIADIDIVKGVRTSLDGDHVAWTRDSGQDDGYFVVCGVTGNLSKPSLDTYTNINGFSPDVNFVAIGGSGELYKASVVANRRVFIANVKIKTKSGDVEKFSDRLMYSEIGKFDTFLEHNFIDVSKGDYGEYVAIESFADRLVAFKNNLVHIINISSPSPLNWYLEETVKYFGANFPFSVAKTKYGIAWVSDDGCYLYDGKSVRNLIDKKVAVSSPSFTATNIPWNDWYRGTAHVKDVMLGYDSISNSLIMMRSPNDSTNNSEQAWVYDFDSNGWSYNTKIFTDSETYTNFITDWNNNLMLGYDDGSTVTFKKYLPVSVSQTAQEFFTKDIDFGQPGLIKKIYKVIVTYRRADSSAVTPFSYAINGTSSFSSFTGNFADTSSVWDVVTLTTTNPISCQSIIIKCSSSGVFEINDMTIEYRILGNKAVT